MHASVFALRKMSRSLVSRQIPVCSRKANAPATAYGKRFLLKMAQYLAEQRLLFRRESVCDGRGFRYVLLRLGGALCHRCIRAPEAPAGFKLLFIRKTLIDPLARFCPTASPLTTLCITLLPSKDPKKMKPIAWFALSCLVAHLGLRPESRHRRYRRSLRPAYRPIIGLAHALHVSRRGSQGLR